MIAGLAWQRTFPINKNLWTSSFALFSAGLAAQALALFHWLVDVEGYVNVQGHRYSVPYLLIGRQLEVRETKDRIDVYHGPRLVASHGRSERDRQACSRDEFKRSIIQA